ncbi:MAG: hypothetical protein GQ537_06465 [Gammaproteobacteria bacterium]|nr:hypothetical protein [Gammaproteobacteria bacterium]
MSGIPLSNESPIRQGVRLGLGVIITFVLAQLYQWPVANLAAAFTVVLLQEPAPMSLRQGWKAFWVSAGFVLTGGLATLILSPWPILLVISMAFLFYWMFIFVIGTGATILEIVAALVAFTIVPVLVLVQPEIGFTAVWGFLIGYAVSILVSWFAWMCIPLLAPPPVANHEAFTQEALKSLALTLSIVMTTLMALFLTFGWSQILVLIYAALFVLGLDLRGGRQMGFNYIIANVVYGGTAILITYELLVMAPNFILMVVTVFFLACVFGYGTFRHGSTEDFWNSGTFGFLIVMGDLLIKDNAFSTQALAGRVWQLVLATAYITLAFSMAEMIKSWRQRKRLIVNSPVQALTSQAGTSKPGPG